MNAAKTKKGGNNRWPATSGRSRSRFAPNQAQVRDFKDWGRGPQNDEQSKPQTPAGATIQSPLASLLGNIAQVFLIDGFIVEGVLSEVAEDLELSLKACVKESAETFQDEQDNEEPAPIFLRKEIIPQLSIQFSHVVSIRIKSGHLSSTGDSFQVDSAISDFTGEVKEKTLTPWQPSHDDHALDALGDDLGHQGPNGWAVEDMLHVNSEKFGVKSTFDSSMSSYMTPIDRDSPHYEEMQRDARRLANEMENEGAFKDRDNCDSGVGEEEAFSAVHRTHSGKDQLSTASRGRGMRNAGHVQRTIPGRDFSGSPTTVRDQSKISGNIVKKNGVAGTNPTPPAMQLSYSDKVKKSCNQDQPRSSLRSDVLPPVAEDSAVAPSAKISGVQNASPRDRSTADHGGLVDRGKDIFNKQKTTYSKYGREVPASKNIDDNNRSDLNDLKKFQSIQLQPGTDSKTDLKSSKRDAVALKRDDHPTKDSTGKNPVPNGSNSNNSGQAVTQPILTHTSSSNADSLPVSQSNQTNDGISAAESPSTTQAVSPVSASLANTAEPETKNVAKASTLNPNAKEFKLNPNAVEFVPRPPTMHPPPTWQQVSSPPMSPMLQQHQPQLQPDMAAYQAQPQQIQLSSQQQQQQLAIQQQQQQQQQPFYSPHPVVMQPDQQRHPGQQRKAPRAMGPQVVFSAGPDYNGIPTPTMSPFYSQAQFVPQIPGGMPMQGQGMPQPSYGEGRHVFVVPQGPGPHPYGHLGGGPMIFPVAQQQMQPNMPPGSVAVRGAGNSQMPNGQIIRYNGMHVVGSMPTLPSSQAYVSGQPMQNYSPMN